MVNRGSPVPLLSVRGTQYKNCKCLFIGCRVQRQRQRVQQQPFPFCSRRTPSVLPHPSHTRLRPTSHTHSTRVQQSSPTRQSFSNKRSVLPAPPIRQRVHLHAHNTHSTLKVNRHYRHNRAGQQSTRSPPNEKERRPTPSPALQVLCLELRVLNSLPVN